LVEMEEGTEESSSPKVAVAELTEVGRNRQATAGRLGFRQRGAWEREGEWVRERAAWAEGDRPRPGSCWASRLDGLAWPLGQDHVLFFFFFPFLFISLILIKRVCKFYFL
jgi:hypothetical protein